MKSEQMRKAFLPKLSQSVLMGLIFLSTASCSFAEVGAKLKEDKTGCLNCLVTHFYEDAKHVLTSPLRWNRQDVLTFAILSGGTFGLMLADEDLQDLVQDHRNSTTNRVSRWTDRYTKRVTNLTIGGFYLSGIIFRNNKAKETALLCLESVALAEGITKGIKHLVGRTRPFGDKGAFHFDPLKIPPPPSSLSFPSGHATAAFALTSVIAEQYHRIPLTIALYGGATVVALARVNNNAHFFSDVFWGGVIGVSVGKALVKFNKENSSEDTQLSLLSQPDLVGIKVVVSLK